MKRPSTPQRQPPSEPTPVVLSVAYPYAAVGPHAVGGAEVILSQLEAAVAQEGFHSAVVAHEHSHTAGRLYPVAVPALEITEAVRKQVERRVQDALDSALAEQPVTLIHMHGLDFHRYRLPDTVPVLVTLHLPPSWYPEAIWSLPPHIHLLCVSETQRQACPAGARDRVQVIENGVPLPDADTLRTRGNYALLLARICPEKNLHTGLDAAGRAGVPAVLGGDVFPYAAHQQYFREQIEPRLTQHDQGHSPRADTGHRQVEARFVGPVSGPAKARLLARAGCLLLPSLAPETSSLVAMEALAAGVPVIAIASGAVPEIVDDGQTGYLIQPGPDATERMAEAMLHLSEISRARCRAVAEQRFPLRRMLDAYLALYRELARPVPHPAPAEDIARAAPKSLPPEVLEHTELTSLEALERLKAEWVALWQADPHTTPFQHPAWLLPWWRQFGPDGHLHALCLRDRRSGLLHALVPFYTLTAAQGRPPLLLLAGAGTSDYLDGVWRDTDASQVLAAEALRYAQHELQDWRRLSFAQLRRGSPLLRAIPSEASWQSSPAEPCSVLATAAALPAKLESNYRRYRRHAEARGCLTFSVAGSPEQAGRQFAILQQLHGERWQGRGESGVLAEQRVLAHHQEALPLLLAAGLLRLFTLTLENEPLAVIYALAGAEFRTDRTLYLYLIGINVKYPELSPGTLLLHAVFNYAKEHGFTQLDFLRGGEDYKRLWGAQPQDTFTLHTTRDMEA